ncbi:MAG: type II toxin-antitoxin system VapC family toxin [Gammaproteobacteria bacterium]
MIIGLIEGDITQRCVLKNQLIHHTVFSSELARLETRLLAVRTDNQDSLKLFDHFFTACEMVELDRAIFEQATLLRANSQLKTPDALHLAAAIYAECEEFWTNDKQLVSVAGKHLKIMDWAALDALR